MWIQATEGAKFWLSILSELRERGVHDILILCADGLTGLPEAVDATYPQAIFQTCIVHMIRASTRFVPWKERKAVCTDLRLIYTAATVAAAEEALAAFETRWGGALSDDRPRVAAALGGDQSVLTLPCRDSSPDLHHQRHRSAQPELRKTIKTRGHLPNDDAALKLLYLALRNACDVGPPDSNLLAAGAPAIRHSLRRSSSAMLTCRRLIHGKPDTLPDH